MSANGCLRHALEYAERGWSVIALHGITPDGDCTCGSSACADAGKHPVARQWKKAATRDPGRLAELFSAGHYNVGIVTGEKSGITVIDIDIGTGKRGEQTWRELNSEAGEPDTLVSKTGSGGMHFIFRYNSALKTSMDTLGPGVDVRNDGGYIVAPPSRHRSGGTYEWVNWGEEPGHLPPHLSKPVERRGRPRKSDPRRSKVGLEELPELLKNIPPDNRDVWRNIGIILGREYNRSEEAWKIYCEWSARWIGKKGRNHDEIMREAFHEISQQASSRELSMGTLIDAALKGGWVPKKGKLPIEAFLYYAPGHSYIYRPTRSEWLGAAVDAGCSPVNVNGELLKPSEWLKANTLITSMTSDPLVEGELLHEHDYREGEIVRSVGGCVFNAYQRPTVEPGDARLAKPWIEHAREVFAKDGDADQFFSYMAHRVQRPGVKPRFALLIAGEPGTGKDTAVEFCTAAIGAWNIANISPKDLDNAFNEYEAKTLVRISETANLQELSKWAFNEQTKVLIAGNPDHVVINRKYGTKFAVRRYCGVILTTNHLLGGIYIPPDDRRYDVIAASTKSEMGLTTDEKARAYFERLWTWFHEEEGARHVAAFLLQRDISKWTPNNPRKTAAHRAVVQHGSQTDDWLLDVIDQSPNQNLLRGDMIIALAAATGKLNEQQVSAKMSHALGRLGFVEMPRRLNKEGRWQAAGKKTGVRLYVRKDHRPTNDEIDAVLAVKEPF